MSNNGYLQIKIREQNEKILKLENEIKQLQTVINFSKQGYDEAKELMTKAIDINKFKQHIINFIKEDVNKNVKEQYHFLANNNEKRMNLLSEIALKKLSERLNNETTVFWHTYAAFIRVLVEGNVLSIGDIAKIDKYATEIKQTGFDKINDALLNKIKQNMFNSKGGL